MGQAFELIWLGHWDFLSLLGVDEFKSIQGFIIFIRDWENAMEIIVTISLYCIHGQIVSK